MFRPLIPYLPARARVPAIIVLWTLRLLALAIVIFFIIYSWRTRIELELMKTQIDTNRRSDQQLAQQVQDQLDMFYRTLYTDPDVRSHPSLEAKVAELFKKLPQRQPSVVELWQLNRDKELRERIQRMERWRLDVQRQLNELR